MSKYNFNFGIDKSGIAKISVSKAGIAFSRECIEYLGQPEKVNIGIDKTNGLLGVRKASNDPSIKAYDFVTNEKKKNWLRINSKTLLSEIAKIAKITLSTESIPFTATYDEEEEVLVVELKKK